MISGIIDLAIKFQDQQKSMRGNEMEKDVFQEMADRWPSAVVEEVQKVPSCGGTS